MPMMVANLQFISLKCAVVVNDGTKWKFSGSPPGNGATMGCHFKVFLDSWKDFLLTHQLKSTLFCQFKSTRSQSLIKMWNGAESAHPNKGGYRISPT